MDPVTVLVVERVVERAIIALFAGISLILGYSLFRAGIVIQQQGEGEWGKLKIKLLSVGPGVFFALFGTIVMIILIAHGLTIPAALATASPTDISSSAPPVKYGTGPTFLELSSISPEDAESITTVLDVIRLDNGKLGLTPAQQDSFDRGVRGLERLRQSAAYKRFPRIAPKYAEWSAQASMNPHFVDSLSQEDKKEFVEMMSFVNSSYLSGGRP